MHARALRIIRITKCCSATATATVLLLQPLWHSSAVSPTAVPSFPGDCRSLLAVYLRSLLVDLLHRLGIREPNVPVPGRRRRTLPLRAMPRHRLAMCAHARCRSGRTTGIIRVSLSRRRIALGRDERGRRRAQRRARAPSWRLEPGRQRSHGSVPVAAFLALPSAQPVPVPPPTHDLIERKRHAGVRRGVDLELRVDRWRRTAARAPVPRNWGGRRRCGRRGHHLCYVPPGALRRRRRVRCRGVLGRG